LTKAVVLDWPATNTQGGWLVHLGEERFFVRSLLFQCRVLFDGRRESTMDSLRNEVIRYVSKDGSLGNGLVKVRRAGKGPTEKSAKFTFQATYYEHRDATVGKPREHTMLFPVSLEVVDGDDHFLPHWAVMEKLAKRELERGITVVRVGVARRPLVDALFAQLVIPFREEVERFVGEEARIQRNVAEMLANSAQSSKPLHPSP
jgi:hypothetical protein